MHEQIAREAFVTALQNSRTIPCGLIDIEEVSASRTHGGMFICSVKRDSIAALGNVRVSRPVDGRWTANVHFAAIGIKHSSAAYVSVWGNLPAES